MTTCIVDDCASPRWAKRTSGYCVKHQRRVDRHGSPDMVRGFRSDEDRFLALTYASGDGCLLWRGNTNDQGYGRFSVEGRSVPAHRWAYEHFVGPIPEGMEPDHLCRVRNCVNHEHIEPVTHRENSQRAAYAQATCKRGHELPAPGANGRRVCRACANERSRAHKARWYRTLTGEGA